MKNWLIRSLGGVIPDTWDEMLRENARIQGARDAEIQWLRQALENSQVREAHLQDIIFKRFGITLPESAAQVNPSPNPVEINRGGWGKQKQRLEKADLKKHLDNLEAQWKKKGDVTNMSPNEAVGE